MNIAYYFPVVGKVVDPLYYLRYCEIECNYTRERAIQSDLLTSLFIRKQYWAVAYRGTELPEAEAIYAFVKDGSGPITAVYIASVDRLIGNVDQLTNIQLHMVPSDINRNPLPWLE